MKSDRSPLLRKRWSWAGHAALAQGLTPQATSQTLAQLEQPLDLRLLHRTIRSLALTEEGLRLQETTQPALAALEPAPEPGTKIQKRDRRRSAHMVLADLVRTRAQGTNATPAQLSPAGCWRPAMAVAVMSEVKAALKR